MKKIFFLAVLAIPLRFLAAQEVLPGYSGFWNRHNEISVLDILEYYPDRLPYLRNEIYARYGRPFVNKEYQDYFRRQSWYRIRNGYTDAWLSRADRYNAELIRSIEQAPAPADILSTLRLGLEYRSPDIENAPGGRLLLFNLSEVVESEVSFDLYGRNETSPNTRKYLVIGDWVVLYSAPSAKKYRVSAYRLNHQAKTITARAEGILDESALNFLIQAQNRLRNQLR
jgi:hypothetical protein